MTTIEIVKAAVVALADQTQGRAIVTELKNTWEQGDHFELHCVDDSERYAKLSVSMDSDTHVTIMVGSCGIAEYDDVPTRHLVNEVEELATAVIRGRISETRKTDLAGQLLTGTVSVMVSGHTRKFSYRSGLFHLTRTKRAEIQYEPYLD